MLKNSFSKLQTESSDSVQERQFDFEVFLTSIKNSILTGKSKTAKNDDIDLGQYLIAYDQLYNFFLLLGGAFQFVAIDVKSKIKVLQEHRGDEIKENDTIVHFSTVKNMIDYEKKKGLLNQSSYVSGCRTLLRLHRGLDFFRKFLKQLYEIKDNTKLSTVARSVYDKTLAEYHTFVVKNTARIAMQFLPTRIELLHKISQNDAAKLSQILQSFPDALRSMDVVYDRIQCLYNANELLDLP